jgi:hypothetical protein
MIRYELDDKESDYLVSLLMQRPLGEAMPLYLKLAQQVQRQQQAAQSPQTGPQALSNGTAAPELHAGH